MGPKPQKAACGPEEKTIWLKTRNTWKESTSRRECHALRGANVAQPCANRPLHRSVVQLPCIGECVQVLLGEGNPS